MMKSDCVGRRTDLISSALADFIRASLGFHRACAISLKIIEIYDILERVEQEIIEVQEAVLTLHKAKQNCSVSATDYATQIQAYGQRMQELEAQQEEQKSIVTRYAEVKAWLDAFEKHIRDGSIMDADDSAILKQLVEQIIVGTSGIEIQFKCGVSIEKDYE